jgi:hypothetical protein
MRLRQVKRAALVGYSVLLFRPPDCVGKTEYVFQRFELPSCPDSAFTMPKSADQPPYELRPGMPGVYPAENRVLCHGFAPYQLREGSRWRRRWLMEASVRLNRGQRCSLDVGYVHSLEIDAPEVLARRAELLARLVMQGSTVAPSIPAASTDRLPSYRELRAWCARPTDSGDRSGVRRRGDGTRRPVAFRAAWLSTCAARYGARVHVATANTMRGGA